MLRQEVCCLTLFICIAMALDCVYPPSVSSQYDEVLLTKKVKFFNSSCTSYNGSLIIDRQSNFTHSELVKLFANLKNFYGLLIIQNVDYETIGFIDKVEYIGDVQYPTSIFLHIRNVTSSSLLISNLKNLTGAQITNNPNLNLSVHCDKFNDLFYNRRDINGNLENCGCSIYTSVFLSRQTIHTIPSNCTVLWMGVYFEEQLDEYIDIIKEKFHSVEHIYNSILIQNTRYDTFDFFPNLKSLEYLQIYANSFLLDIDFPKLERLDALTINTNPEAFCVPMSFLRKFIHNASSRFEVQPCVDDEGSGVKTCRFNGNLLDLEDNCENIIGVLKFENVTLTDPELNKLKHMKTLYGFLKIVNTSIKDLSFLYNLEEIYTTVRDIDCRDGVCFQEEGSPLALIGNNNLTEYIVPKLKFVYDGQRNGIHLDYPKSLDPGVCDFYRKIHHDVRNGYMDCQY